MDLVGHVVGGRYEVKEQLQGGFYGMTWLAVDTNTATNVCLKTFFNEKPSQKKELEVLKQLCDGHFNHENLCRVLDVSLDRAPVTTATGVLTGMITFVTFEYCSGSDMFNFLCSGPWEKYARVVNFSEVIARHYFKQAVLGVMYLHERGVYHRDIKPENCVLDGNLNLKLTDFGTNKIFTQVDQMQMLRTKTSGIGTESYRAPEVNSGREYDPAPSDIWSLGVMLFFFVGIEQMLHKVKYLDQYSKQVFAPLGIFFPFPVHCSKLESYLKREGELRAKGINGSYRAATLPNTHFWEEWSSLRDTVSPDLIDLFNRIFVLEPSLRITLRDMLRHPWLNVQDHLTPDVIRQEMSRRSPSSIGVSQDANPTVLGPKLLGGVDQVVLRGTLSGTGTEQIDFLEDMGLWEWSKYVQHLEAIQLLIQGMDLQDLIMDITWLREKMHNILKQPENEQHRIVSQESLTQEWIAELLLVLGFLPHGHTLFLLDECRNLPLLSNAIDFLHGVELAVTKSGLSTTNQYESDSDNEMEMPFEDEVDTNGVPIQVPMLHRFESTEGAVGPDGMPYSSFETPLGSSQGSSLTWAMSAHSSQEEVPECNQLIHDWNNDYNQDNLLVPLNVVVNVGTPQQFLAAGEFCKLSGLLCSYGLYQVVYNEQLVLYCRGNTASISMRIVHCRTSDGFTSQLYISTWCFAGHDEWKVILDRLSHDMT